MDGHPLAAARGLGLTLNELQSAMKVVEKLRLAPEMFETEPVLQETKLWQVLTRPKHLKKKWRKVTNVVKKLRKKRFRKTGKSRALLQSEMFRRKAADHNKAAGVKLIQNNETDHGDNRQTSATTLCVSQSCYVCSIRYTTLHPFYHMMCGKCGNENYAKRTLRRDLTNKVFIVTGARIKIGYQIVLKLLRDGATVVATTRFTSDAAERYAAEPDFALWKGNLILTKLDLRCITSIRVFCRYIITTYGVGGVFGLINNAAQTIAREPGYYTKLINKEAAAAVEGQSATTLSMLTFCEETEDTKTVDAAGSGTQSENMYDTMQEYTDGRRKNSWTTRLHEVGFGELIDVFSVNTIAPFTLTSLLTPALQGTPACRHHIINVSAMEGVFYKPFKSVNHPHTNMAKASLNMMTRTSGHHYASQHNIIMNAVDTGWVTDESPKHIKFQNIAKNLVAPLDEIDGASRVLDPIYTDTQTHSRFWKDYKISVW